ncbi:MAG: peroxiredoxin [Bacteroidetes bacterium RIFOXYB2_FULL_35_7]|nr:MAG: peroxiredoxin [Bacteroidetes bacterium GWF2_35_48]OFY94041.1 MAG: peroxiredoxin [Bacteroidetes bacterium RIFOXYB2_FULL_35_7]HBX53512.1 thioredoxin-dependent thiol peroxidase [Bacteroidales bacterium]
MTKLQIGDKAPDFKGIDQNGSVLSFSDFKGKKLVLFFYPKDNTPGCTEEACNLRDNYSGFQQKGYEVVGISKDSDKSHMNFISKYNLPFNLISDTEKKIINDYGVWGEKIMYGKKIEGLHRTTFIISEKGIIENIITKVDTKNHAVQIFK